MGMFAIALCAAMLLLSSEKTDATVTGTPVPHFGGIWSLGTDTYADNETIVLGSDIMIASGVSLYLDNCTIVFDSSDPSMNPFYCYIVVEGMLNAKNTVFMKDPTPLGPVVYNLDTTIGIVYMEGCYVKDIGVEDPLNPGGMTSSGGVIYLVNTAINDSIMGVAVKSPTGSAAIMDCTFVNCTTAVSHGPSIIAVLIFSNAYEMNGVNADVTSMFVYPSANMTLYDCHISSHNCDITGEFTMVRSSLISNGINVGGHFTAKDGGSTISVNGALTVSGLFEAYNEVIEMDTGLYNGQSWIEVKSTGTFITDNVTIRRTVGTTFAYDFWMNGNMTLNNTLISDCGYYEGSYGLNINSYDSATLYFENSTFNGFEFVLTEGNLVIKHSDIIAYAFESMYGSDAWLYDTVVNSIRWMISGNETLVGCTVQAGSTNLGGRVTSVNGLGIIVHVSFIVEGMFDATNDTMIMDTTVDGGSYIYVHSSGTFIGNNLVIQGMPTGTHSYDFYCGGSIQLTNATVMNCGYSTGGTEGIYITAGSGTPVVSFEGCTFRDNYKALIFTGGTPVVRNSTFDNNSCAVHVFSGAPIIEGNKIVGKRNASMVGLPSTNYTIEPIPYSWVDGITGGTVVTNSNLTWGTSDEGYLMVPLPTPIHFYGNAYNTMYIYTNGQITFIPYKVYTYGNMYDRLTTPLETNCQFALCFADMDFDSMSRIYYKFEPERFIVTYSNYKYYGNSNRLTCEAIIYYNGYAIFNYQSATAWNIRVGVENEDSSSDTVYLCDAVNNSPISDSFSLLLTPPTSMTTLTDNLGIICENGASGGIIADNRFFDTYGINMQDSAVAVYGNYFFNCTPGIQANQSTKTVSGNNFKSCSVGMIVMGDSSIVVFNSVFLNCSNGVVAMGGLANVTDSTFIKDSAGAVQMGGIVTLYASSYMRIEDSGMTVSWINVSGRMDVLYSVVNAAEDVNVLGALSLTSSQLAMSPSVTRMIFVGNTGSFQATNSVVNGIMAPFDWLSYGTIFLQNTLVRYCGSSSYDGIHIYDGNLTMLGGMVAEFPYGGIYIMPSADSVVLSDVTLTGRTGYSPEGIYMNGFGASISGCYIARCYTGIYMYSIADYSLGSATIDGCQYGVHIYECSNVTLGQTITITDTFGIIKQYAIGIDYSDDVFINSTVIADPTSMTNQFGIYAYLSDGVVIENVSISTHEISVYCSYSTMYIANSTFSNHDYGILGDDSEVYAFNTNFYWFSTAGVSLDYSTATIVQCEFMWNAIGVDSEGELTMVNSNIYYGNIGIVSSDKCSLTDIYLDDINNVGIELIDCDATVYSSYIDGVYNTDTGIAASGATELDIIDVSIAYCADFAIDFEGSMILMQGGEITYCTNGLGMSGWGLIDGVHFVGMPNSAILTKNGAGETIQYVTIEMCGVGIDIGAGTAPGIIYSDISNCGIAGIRAVNGQLIIVGTDISDSANGILATKSTGNVVGVNVVRAGTYGIMLEDSPDISLGECSATECEFGFYLKKSGSILEDLTATADTCGIFLFTSSPIVKGSTIDNCTMGIVLYLGAQPTITECALSNNMLGVYGTVLCDFAIENSVISGTMTDFYLLAECHGRALNTTFSISSVYLNESVLEVAWFVNVHVVDEAGAPLSSVQVMVTDGLGALCDYGTTFMGYLRDLQCTGCVLRSTATPETVPYTEDWSTNPHVVTVSDGISSAVAIQNVTSSLTIDVTLNRAPELILQIPELTLYEDVPANNIITLADYFMDVVPLTFSVIGGTNVVVSVNNTGNLGVVSITPSSNWSGSEQIKFRATDTLGAYTDCTVMVRVLPVNDAPTITNGAVTVYEDVATIFDASALVSDIDSTPSELYIYTNNSYITVHGMLLTILLPDEALVPGAANIIPVAITVSDGALAATATLTITAYPVNDAPTLAPIPDIIVTENVTSIVNLMPYVSDIDNSTAELVFNENSAYCTIVGSNISLLYTTQGVYSEMVRITISDGLLSAFRDVQVTVVPVNDAPSLATLSPITVTEGVNYELDLSAYVYDPDSPLNSLSLSTTSPYATVAGLSIVLNYPNAFVALGTTDTITVTISDGFLSDSETLDVTITPVNDAPAIAVLPNIVVYQHTEYVLDVAPYISDPDNAVASLTISENSAFAVVSGQNIIFNYTSEVVTSEIVRITISDGLLSVYQDIVVTVLPVNDPPVFAFVPQLTVTEGTAGVFDLSSYISDPDSPVTMLKLSSNSTHATFDGLTMFLSYDNSYVYPSGNLADDILVVVSDAYLSASRNISISIIAVNDGPSFSLSSLTVNRDDSTPFDISAYVSDPDNTLSELTITEDSEYIAITGTNLSYAYPLGIYTELVTFTVSDGTSAITKVVTVSVNGGSYPPSISVPDQTAIEDVRFELNLAQYITDVDTPIGSLAAWTDTPNVTLNGLVLIATFTDGQTGGAVKVYVSDGRNVVNGTFNIYVTPVNDAPVLAALPDVSVLQGAASTLDLAGYISDVDTALSSLVITTDSPSITVSGTTLTINYASVGTGVALVKVTLSDGMLTDVKTMRVTIRESNHAPTLTDVRITPDNADSSMDVTVSVVYADADGDAPTLMSVSIDGTKSNLAATTEGNYTSGKEYHYTLKLAKGTHVIFFECSDGKATVSTVPMTKLVKAEDNRIAQLDSKVDNSNNMLLVALIVVAACAGAIIFFMQMRTSKVLTELSIMSTKLAQTQAQLNSNDGWHGPSEPMEPSKPSPAPVPAPAPAPTPAPAPAPQGPQSMPAMTDFSSPAKRNADLSGQDNAAKPLKSKGVEGEQKVSENEMVPRK